MGIKSTSFMKTSRIREKDSFTNGDGGGCGGDKDDPIGNVAKRPIYVPKKLRDLKFIRGGDIKIRKKPNRIVGFSERKDIIWTRMWVKRGL